MVYEYTFWNDNDRVVGKAWYIGDEIVHITELDGKKTSIIKKDGEVFENAVNYLQRHIISYIPAYVIYDIRHYDSYIESMMARTAAHRKGWLRAPEVEKEDEELAKEFLG